MEVGADPSPESIDRELARAEANKRRTRLVFAGSALFAVIGVVVLQLARTHQQKRVLHTAWNDAAGCLFGGPLKPDETGSIRFRAIKLANAGSEDKKRWPERCADALATLNHTLVKQKRTGDLANHSHELVTELEKGHGMTNLSYVVDRLVDAAAAIELSAADITRPDERPPPEPVQAWNITSLAESRLTKTALGAHAVSSDRWPGADLRLLFHDPKTDAPPVLCSFDDSGPDGHCREIGGAARTGKDLRLRGTSDRRAPPLLFGRALGEDVVYRADTGEEVTRGNIQSAWIADNGYIALATGPIDDDIGTFELLQKKAGKALTRELFGPDDFDATTITNWAVAFGQLVVQSVYVDDEAEDQQLPRFRARALPAANPKAGFVDAGELDWVNAPLSFCATQSTLALKVGTRSGYLVFFQKGSWSTPSPRERLGALVQCRGDAMLLHDFGPVRACTATDCKDAGLTDTNFAAIENVRSRRTVLGDKVLGIAESERREGLRYVYGAGEVTMLFDDLVRQGEVQTNSTISGTRIFSRAGFAVALLFSEDGVLAVYFGKDGKAQPAKVSWAH